MADRYENRNRRWQRDQDWSDRQIRYYGDRENRQQGDYRNIRNSGQNRYYPQNQDFDRGVRERFNRGMNNRDYDRDWDDYSQSPYDRGQFDQDYDNDQDWDFNFGDYGRQNRWMNSERDYNRRNEQRGGNQGGSNRGFFNRDYNRYTRNRNTEWDQGPDWDENRDWGTGYTPSDYRQRGQGNFRNRESGYPYQSQDFNRDYDQDFGSDYDIDQPTYWAYEEWWIVPGPYSGIGPRGYHRSDERIREDINERLMQHGRIDARNIEVVVNNGEVTLNGSVNNRQAKRLAEDTVETVSGVRDVHNHLKVEQQRGWAGQHERGAEGWKNMRKGMDVVASDGDRIGTVKDLRDQDFVIDRPSGEDLHIPYSACQAVHDQVVLNISSDQVNQQNWANPQTMQNQNRRGES